ncbi:hypothetical protein MTsDn1_13280 [Alteromonas sp. MTD1]|uniref:hypothetical protein n=1 Tax=Alteromonas sp. MTD1 TaxID=3057962 RepID=UPI0036F25593
MKISSALFATALLPLVACTSVVDVIDQQTDVQSDQSRIDFFANRGEAFDNQREFVTLMCFNNRPDGALVVRDVQQGEHVLFVRASVINNDLPIGNKREAIVRLNVNLEGGKRYSLNQVRDNHDMKVWLEEYKSGKPVSEIVSTRVEYPEFVGDLRLEQCREGTV